MGLFGERAGSGPLLDPGHGQKDRVQSGGQDQKNLARPTPREARKRVAQMSVGAAGQAIAAQGAGQAGTPFFQVDPGQGVVAACFGAEPALRAAAADGHAPGQHTPQQVVDQADGAIGCAVDHGPGPA